MTLNPMVKNLEETLQIINLFIDKGMSFVNAKKVRKYLEIDSSNRPKIYYIWRSLQFLQKKGILEEIHRSKIITYKLVRQERIKILEFIKHLEIN